MLVPKKPVVYYVVFFEFSYSSLEEVLSKAPQEIALHKARSKEFQARGTLLMAVVFINNPNEPLTTMAILTTRETAEEFAKGDPFVLNGMVKKWYIREVTDILA